MDKRMVKFILISALLVGLLLLIVAEYNQIEACVDKQDVARRKINRLLNMFPELKKEYVTTTPATNTG